MVLRVHSCSRLIEWNEITSAHAILNTWPNRQRVWHFKENWGKYTLSFLTFHSPSPSTLVKIKYTLANNCSSQSRYRNCLTNSKTTYRSVCSKRSSRILKESTHILGSQEAKMNPSTIIGNKKGSKSNEILILTGKSVVNHLHISKKWQSNPWYHCHRRNLQK